MASEVTRAFALLRAGLCSSTMLVHRKWIQGAVQVRVLYVESRSRVRVVVGAGVGQLDGGIEQTFDAADVPEDLQRPNAVFWIVPTRFA